VDFAVMAVLFAVLLGLSSFELVLRSETGKWQGEGLREKAFEHASTTAFIGILVSIGAGVAASTMKQYNLLTLVLPVGLLLLWMRFQRDASKAINFEGLANQLDRQYSEIILTTAKNRPRLNDEDLYLQCLAQAQEADAFFAEISKVVGKRAIAVPLFATQSIFQSFVFPRERFNRLIETLRKERKLQASLPPIGGALGM